MENNSNQHNNKEPKKEDIIELKDEEGNKIRDIKNIGNGNYLIHHYDKNGRRIRASIVNVETGEEEYSDYEFNKNGEETLLKHYEDGMLRQELLIEYDDLNNPVKMTEKDYIYDENDNIKETKIYTKEIQYEKDGTFKGFKYTDTN